MPCLATSLPSVRATEPCIWAGSPPDLVPLDRSTKKQGIRGNLRDSVDYYWDHQIGLCAFRKPNTNKIKTIYGTLSKSLVPKRNGDVVGYPKIRNSR